MEKLMTSADLGKVIYIDPLKQPTATLLKVPRKLKKKMKKEGSWGMPVFTVAEMPMNFIKNFEVWESGIGNTTKLTYLGVGPHTIRTGSIPAPISSEDEKHHSS